MHRVTSALWTLLFTSAMPFDAAAQAVQLPTFHYFGVGTTVSVPDRGAAYLGGVSRAASGRASRSVPLLGKAPGVGRLGRNDAYGSTVGTSGVYVSATIIDHHELDQAVLAEARARRGGRAVTEPGLAESAEPLRANIAMPAAPPRTVLPLASVADILHQQQQQDQAVRHESLSLIEKGRQAEAAGKPGVAKVYYQMAARRAAEPLSQRIVAHLANMDAAERHLAAAHP